MRGGGHIVLMRHALAPGTGDPPGFTLEDCTTQRNLSDEGRMQAARTGALFRQHGISEAAIYSSRWCRCIETARLLDLGPVEILPALDSFFRDRRKERPQTRALMEWLRARDLTRPLVLVTHQVNITALTGIFPQSGEMIVVRLGEQDTVEVVGRLMTP
jgi:broad specificity phosphatase PhoE